MIEIRHSWAYKIYMDWNQQSTVCDTARHQNTSPLRSHFDVYKWYAAVPCLYSRNFKPWKLLVHGIQQKQPKTSWCPISISQACNYVSHVHMRKKVIYQCMHKSVLPRSGTRSSTQRHLPYRDGSQLASQTQSYLLHTHCTDLDRILSQP